MTYRPKTILILFAAAMALFVAASCGGCAPVNKDTKAYIDQGKQDTKKKTADIRNAAEVSDAQVTVDPARHPFRALGQVVKAARGFLAGLSLLAFVVLAASIGVAFTPFGFIAKIATPIAGSVFIFAFCGLIALPFLGWILGAILLGLMGLFVYEVVKWKNLRKALAASEASITFIQPQPTA